MPAKIRLQRFGKKGRPFYHIVIADGRAPRDGRSIEKLGSYDPLTNPATIELDFEKALHWIQVGAQPTDTVRSILSYKGVMLKSHLLKGVAKGALTEEQAEVKYNEWLSGKDAQINAKKSDLASTERDEKKTRFDAEAKVNEARLEVLNKRKADELAAVEAKAAEAAAALAAVAAVAAEKEAEKTAKEAEKAAKEAAAAPKAEATEAPAEEVAETPAAEDTKEETAE